MVSKQPESTMERLENDSLDEKVKEKMKLEKKGFSEPFIEPEEI